MGKGLKTLIYRRVSAKKTLMQTLIRFSKFIFEGDSFRCWRLVVGNVNEMVEGLESSSYGQEHEALGILGN